MLTNRAQEKNSLFIKLGTLFGPLQHLAANPNLYDEQERSEIIARYFSDYQLLLREFVQFCQGQTGHQYVIEHHKFQAAVEGVTSDLLQGKVELPELVSRRMAEAQAAIAAIPIPRDSTILEAGTPFSTYCMLKDLCEADTTRELVLIDAYMDMTVFHRFLRGAKVGIAVTLVTSEPRSTASARERARWNEFLDISRLFSQECGNASYQLIVHQGLLHDRWLLLDYKRLYSLGGSTKDAGNRQYFTIARIDASASNLQIIQTHISTGREYFGQNVPNHL